MAHFSDRDPEYTLTAGGASANYSSGSFDKSSAVLFFVSPLTTTVWSKLLTSAGDQLRYLATFQTVCPQSRAPQSSSSSAPAEDDASRSFFWLKWVGGGGGG